MYVFKARAARVHTLPVLFHLATKVLQLVYVLFHLVTCNFTFPMQFQLNTDFPIHSLMDYLRAVLLLCKIACN